MRSKKFIGLTILICLGFAAVPLAQAAQREPLAPTSGVWFSSGPLDLHRMLLERTRWILRLAARNTPVVERSSGAIRPDGLADDADPIGLREEDRDEASGRDDSQENNEGTQYVDSDPLAIGMALPGSTD